MRKREYEKFIEEVRERLTAVRSLEGYGTTDLPFSSGQGSALLWVLDFFGEEPPQWPTLPTPPSEA